MQANVGSLNLTTTRFVTKGQTLLDCNIIIFCHYDYASGKRQRKLLQTSSSSNRLQQKTLKDYVRIIPYNVVLYCVMMIPLAKYSLLDHVQSLLCFLFEMGFFRYQITHLPQCIFLHFLCKIEQLEMVVVESAFHVIRIPLPFDLAFESNMFVDQKFPSNLPFFVLHTQPVINSFSQV